MSTSSHVHISDYAGGREGYEAALNESGKPPQKKKKGKPVIRLSVIGY
jgi:hypothetical protein